MKTIGKFLLSGLVMNKLLLIALCVVAGLAIFFGLKYFLGYDPIAPYTSKLLSIVTGLSPTLIPTIQPFLDILKNPAVLGSLGLAVGGAVVSYVKSRAQQTLEQKAKETIDNLQTQVITEANQIGQLQVQNAKLENKLAEYNLTEIADLKKIIESKDKTIEKLTAEKNEAERIAHSLLEKAEVHTP